MTQRKSPRRWGPDGPRVDAAEIITGPERRAIIDGVTVDLRHPDINAYVWEPRPWWHFASDGEGSARLTFPSDEAMSVPPLAGAIELSPGDTVSVSSVEAVEVGPGFLHEHDAKRLVANLLLTRPDGSAAPAGSLRFFGTTGLRDAPPHQMFERMAARICDTFDLAKLNDYDLPPFAAKERGLADEAAYNLRRAQDKYRSLERCLASLDEGPERRDESYRYWGPEWWLDYLPGLLNHAALGGYLLARSEISGAEEALVERQRVEATLAAGRLKLKDYDNRRLRAREVWAAHPSWTINRVATEVARELGKDKASVMASLWEEVPSTSSSFVRAKEKLVAQ